MSFTSIWWLTVYASFLCIRSEPVSVSDDLVLNKVERNVDVSTHLIKISTSIIVENTGKTTAKYFLYAIDQPLLTDVAFIGAAVNTFFFLLLLCTPA